VILDWKGLLWKLYFLVFTILLLFAYSHEFDVTDRHKGILLFDTVITFFSLIGLFGLAFRTDIFSAYLWRRFFYFFIAWDFILNFVILPWLNPQALAWVSYSVGFIVFLPNYVAVYLYGHKFLREKTERAGRGTRTLE
jgi:hypothetical protein